MTIEYSKSKKCLQNNFLDLIVFDINSDTAYIVGYNGEVQMIVKDSLAQSIKQKTLDGYLDKE